MKVLAVCGAQGALIFKFKRYLLANVEPRAVFHTKAEEQWKLNFGEIPFIKSFSEMPRRVDLTDIDLLIGSPSCGHSSRFSYSRKKSLGNPKEDPTMNLFIDSVIELNPKVFMMENLPKLLDLIPIDEWRSKLPNYDLTLLKYPVSVFGNSQITRVRLVMVGVERSCKELWGIKVIPFVVNQGPERYKELLKKVRKPLDYHEDDDKRVSMYHFSDDNKKSLTVAEVRALWKNQFKAHYRWPMFGHKMKTLPGVYRNKLDSYPLTLRPSNRQFNPDGSIMGLEIYRVIMGFPKRYQIYFDENNKTYWLNKARTALTKGSVAEVGIWAYRLLRPYFIK